MLRTLLAAALLLLVPAATALAGSPTAKTTIVGGQTADIDDWPSIAFLLSAWDSDGDGRLDAQAHCTGTVIAPQWVVSAAHCAFGPDGPVDAMVTLTGVGDLEDPNGEAIVADQLVVHPDWDPQTLAGDALLIHLRAPSSRPAHPVARHRVRYVTQPGVPNAAGWRTTDEDSKIGRQARLAGAQARALQARHRGRRRGRQRGATRERGVQDGAVTSLALGRHTAMMSRIEMMPWTSPLETTTR